MRTLIDACSRLNHVANPPGVDADGQGLRMAVVATTDLGTRAALAAARDLGLGLDPYVVLFVPHVVPYGQPLEGHSSSVAFMENRFRKLVEEAGTDAMVRVCVCRPDVASLETLLPQDMIVLVGGISGRLWRSREERLARRLTALGHRALFIDAARNRHAATSDRDA